MNFASLELCRTLFELTGWDYETVGWRPWWGLIAGEYDVADVNLPGQDFGWSVPAYDLGFILRKTNIGVRPHDKGWRAFFYDETAIADTPEDAAVKLCIALCKAGLLRRQAQMELLDRVLELPDLQIEVPYTRSNTSARHARNKLRGERLIPAIKAVRNELEDKA